eukprot:scaffold5125_cov134-Isochrysis_galbana.AAC.10
MPARALLRRHRARAQAGRVAAPAGAQVAPAATVPAQPAKRSTCGHVAACPGCMRQELYGARSQRGAQAV